MPHALAKKRLGWQKLSCLTLFKRVASELEPVIGFPGDKIYDIISQMNNNSKQHNTTSNVHDSTPCWPV
jgi:hypothetical protein